MEDGREHQEAEEAEAAGRRPAVPEENEARVVGRIVNPAKLKEGTTAKGSPYKMARFTLAVNRTYRDSKGGKGRETDFIPVVVWDALAQAVVKAGKGTALRVSGRIKTYQVEGKGYRWELKCDTLQVLDLKPADRAEAAAQPEPEDRKMQAAGEGAAEPQEELIPY